MPVVALLLLLAAASMHATWNFFAKGARNNAALSFSSAACAAIVYAPAVAISAAIDRPQITRTALAFVAGTSFLQVAYFYMLGQGYKRGDLSLVYPLARGTGPTLAIIGAVILFGERPSWLALVGAAGVVGGILVMSWSNELRGEHGVATAVGFALATGAVTATYTLVDKRGVGHLAPFYYGYGIEVGRAVLVAPFVLATSPARQRLRATLDDQRKPILAIGVLSVGAYMMVLTALTLAPVSYVAPARELSILIGAILGLRLLGESHPVRRLTGAAAIVLGIVALALG